MKGKKEKLINIIICDGVEGTSLYINDYRVAGPKPWGGGRTMKEWNVPKSELLKALGRHSVVK